MSNVAELNEVIDRRETVTELFRIRAEIAEIEERVLRPLKQQKAVLEATLLQNLEVDEGVSFTGVGTVKVFEEIAPRVVDWEELYNYIRQTGRLDLLPSRINAVPYREMLNVEGGLVGVEPITIRKLRVRKD